VVSTTALFAAAGFLRGSGQFLPLGFQRPAPTPPDRPVRRSRVPRRDARRPIASLVRIHGLYPAARAQPAEMPFLPASASAARSRPAAQSDFEPDDSLGKPG